MAAFGKVQSSAWSDPDFRQLDMPAQWLYIVLLSSPDRNLLGVVPFTPRRWQSGVAHVHIDEIGKALDLLTERRFVLVDEQTAELLIRTITKHDPPRNPSAIVGMWRQWQRVSSPELRRAVVEQMPVDLWLRSAGYIPDEAGDIRRSAGIRTDVDISVDTDAHTGDKGS
jgi:hypothetical protein